MSAESLELRPFPERVQAWTATARLLAADAAARAPLEGQTSPLSHYQAGAVAELLAEQARRVVAEWVRARNPATSQPLAVAVLALRDSIRVAAAELPALEPVAEAAEKQGDD